MRMRKKKNLQRRMEACSDLWIRDPVAYRGRWRELLPGAQKLRLELGCGKGRFTADTAATCPGELYVAVERVPDAMVIAMERCRDRGLKNVFFIDGDAAALSDYFAPDEVDLLYINFCDPWPTVKHAARRLTHENFLRGYREVLADGGQIHFKTDNRDLFEWSLFQFPKAGFELSEVTRDLHANGIQGILTDYEEKFHNLGTPINRCVGTKGPLPDVPIAVALGELLPGWEVRTAEKPEDLLPLYAQCTDFLSLEEPCTPQESAENTLNSIPPRCVPSQKHVLTLYKDDKLAAVLDLVENYPRPRFLFVGLFLLAPDLRRQGNGRAIVDALTTAADRAGLDRVRLACLQCNPQGHAFWNAVGFSDLREGTLMGENGAPVWILQKLAQ